MNEALPGVAASWARLSAPLLPRVPRLMLCSNGPNAFEGSPRGIRFISNSHGEIETMLGDLVSETRGKRVVRRALPDGKAEITLEDAGTILGVKCSGFGTYVAEVRPDGSLYGEGQGAYMTANGEMARWKGMGVGKFQGAGVSYRGALSFQSNSPTLSRLNSIAVIFEFETDEQGNTHSKSWEWK